ncbi:MAG: ribonuclease HII [Dehalococcoidia bacterium]|nr:ribonuclease HII [Dehalococcoidia bacterium]
MSHIASPVPVPTLDRELALWAAGTGTVAGLDEVGRGALAGPVVAAAVVLPSDRRPAWLGELRDSKLLTARARERLAAAIREESVAVAVGYAGVAVIDGVNILQATWLAMERAIAALPALPDHLLIDGRPVGRRGWPPATAIVRGDATVCSIAAASIVAKVSRDRFMVALDREYPGYGFAGHKGYAARTHLEAIRDLGVSNVHRRTFAPVRSRLCGDGHLEELLARVPVGAGASKL